MTVINGPELVQTAITTCPPSRCGTKPLGMISLAERASTANAISTSRYGDLWSAAISDGLPDPAAPVMGIGVEGTGMAHLTGSNADLIARVRRIAGQVNAVERELVADASCAKVLHLVAAVRGAVNGLMGEIIAEHLEAHVARAGLTDEERAKGADELLAVIRR